MNENWKPELKTNKAEKYLDNKNNNKYNLNKDLVSLPEEELKKYAADYLIKNNPQKALELISEEEGVSIDEVKTEYANNPNYIGKVLKTLTATAVIMAATACHKTSGENINNNTQEISQDINETNHADIETVLRYRENGYTVPLDSVLSRSEFGPVAVEILEKYPESEYAIKVFGGSVIAFSMENGTSEVILDKENVATTYNFYNYDDGDRLLTTGGKGQGEFYNVETTRSELTSSRDGVEVRVLTGDGETECIITTKNNGFCKESPEFIADSLEWAGLVIHEKIEDYDIYVSETRRMIYLANKGALYMAYFDTMKVDNMEELKIFLALPDEEKEEWVRERGGEVNKTNIDNDNQEKINNNYNDINNNGDFFSKILEKI